MKAGRDHQTATTRLAHAGPRRSQRKRVSPVKRTCRGKNASTGFISRKRHGRPLTPETRRLLDVIHSRFDAGPLTVSGVAEKIGCDKSDVSRCLRLTEEPTTRVLAALCEFYGVAKGTELLVAERERLLLVRLETKLNDAARLAGELRLLRTSHRAERARDNKPV